MRDEEAVDYINKRIQLPEGYKLVPSEFNDFPQYKYVDVVEKETEKPIGGNAYVIDLISEPITVYVVPNTLPAHFNLRSVFDEDALELVS